MKRSGTIAFVAALLLGLAATAAGQDAPTVFLGYKGDTQIWKDEIRLEQGRIIDEVDGLGGNPDREAVTNTGNPTGELFAEKANGLPAHSVVVKGEFVCVYDGQGMTGMLGLEAQPLVFDVSLPSHYRMLLGRYDARKGGTQQVSVIVPEKDDYWKLEIAPRPAASIALGTTQLESKVYQFKVDFNKYATIWMLDGTVAAVYLPWNDEYMVDARYPMLQQKIQMLVKRSI
jgi:hypothetical protein